MRISNPPRVAAALTAIVLFVPSTLAGAELRGLVPNNYEEAAAAEGRRLGIGSATLEGPDKVEALSHQTFTTGLHGRQGGH